MYSRDFQRRTERALDYNKIKIGVKNLEDAILNVGSYNTDVPQSLRINKPMIFKAIAENDIKELRRISRYYYNISGIYSTVCNYFAFLYRYDWYIAAHTQDDNVKVDKILIDFAKTLEYLDNSYLKKQFGEIALQVIKEGCYYGYLVPSKDSMVLQQLPADYCRSRFSVGQTPAVEFNMKYFDTFKDTAYRLKILKLFPEEFAKGYILYKSGKLASEVQGDRDSGWYLLEPENTVKFNFNGNDNPIFINAIPSIIDLDAAQDLDRRKQMQKLLKIIIQKLPMDKNGDLIFDIDEARDIHNTAVDMLRRAIGVDVLTTFTDVDSIDLSDKNTSATTDDLEKVERTVYNNLGISRNLFNTDGNLSLTKSILNDESTVRNLLLQFNLFMDRVIRKFNGNNKKYSFKIYFLETTQYNYQELSKLYKEQTQMGGPKLLPQIALGHSQSAILNTIYFENNILNLSSIMIPPLMSSTLSSEDILGKSNSSNSSKTQNTTEQKSVGRPSKDEGDQSDKTIQNKESMN